MWAGELAIRIGIASPGSWSGWVSLVTGVIFFLLKYFSNLLDFHAASVGDIPQRLPLFLIPLDCTLATGTMSGIRKQGKDECKQGEL